MAVESVAECRWLSALALCSPAVAATTATISATTATTVTGIKRLREMSAVVIYRSLPRVGASRRQNRRARPRSYGDRAVDELGLRSVIRLVTMYASPIGRVLPAAPGLGGNPMNCAAATGEFYPLSLPSALPSRRGHAP